MVNAPASTIPALERMLLSALISSDAVRAEILPQLLPEATQSLRLH